MPAPQEVIGRRRSGLTIVLAMAGFLPAQGQDDKLEKRAAQLSAQFVKALEGLARTCDEKNDPEAAHLLASCALGFGSKDPKISTLKGAREVDRFVGNLRGGELLADANPIDAALRGIEVELKKILDQ